MSALTNILIFSELWVCEVGILQFKNDNNSLKNKYIGKIDKLQIILLPSLNLIKVQFTVKLKLFIQHRFCWKENNTI